MSKISQWLFDYISKNGVNCAWLSKRTGIPYNTIMGWKHNKKSLNPSLESIVIIARLLEIDLNELKNLERETGA